MARLIDKDDLVAEIKKIYNEDYRFLPSDLVESVRDFKDDLLAALDTLEVKEVDLENYNKVKKVLSISFMNFLDDNRPENKMCLSNGECFDIEKAFDELDFAKLFRYMEKYLKSQKGE